MEVTRKFKLFPVLFVRRVLTFIYFTVWIVRELLALIMMKVLPGKEFLIIGKASKAIKDNLVKMDGKPFIYLFAGPYDVIACVKTKGMEELKAKINTIRRINGVLETVTHVAIES